ncbi:MAG TPA: zf-HC2 domain-containing protein [Candidatus Acidoferrum sp.]|jgi:anti-sigma factor RsiW|nr:zf-HC2 domain-containing protein [Candidatus Acidoferrum sp.]
MTCREVIDVLVEYLEQNLSTDVAQALERHLADCAPCRAYLATYQRTRAVGAEAQRLDMPAEMKDRLRQFLFERLQGRA